MSAKPVGITIHMTDASKNVKLLGAEVSVEIDMEECPAHGAWVPKMSRKGKAFWGCKVPDGEDYCFLRPSWSWKQKHDAAGALMMAQETSTEPPATPGTPTEQASDYDDLPF